MPKKPVRRIHNPLQKKQQKRVGRRLLLFVFGSTLLFLLGLNIKLLLQRSHDTFQEKNPLSGGANNLQQQQRHGNIVPAPKGKTDGRFPTAADTTTLLIFSSAKCQGTPSDKASAKTEEAVTALPNVFPKSVLVQGKGLAEVYVGAGYPYQGTVMELEGCVDFYDLYKEEKPQAKFLVYSAANQNKVLTSKRQISEALQRQFATVSDLNKPHTRFVFSCTSSKYFGYQVYANAKGFIDSKQTDASWTRLLSAGQVDDLSEKFPTFTAPKSLYQTFYQPINKADVIDQWFHSPDAPHPDDTIVVIDPDNWLINDLLPWAKRVTSKNALGQAAYYEGNPMLQDLWQEICRKNCHSPTDPGAVPYLLKASDLKEVAPLWRAYSIDIKERFKNNATFKEKYGPGLGVRWASEMFGFNSACTHLGIKTTIVSDMQLRDVDGGKRNWDKLRDKMPMIHMGRAWFPKDKPELAAPWRHSLSNEPASVAASGIQVWCKCNGTASSIQPWPLPKDMDFVSYHTLRLLHDSTEKFGPVPVNETYRREKPVFYAWSVP